MFPLGHDDLLMVEPEIDIVLAEVGRQRRRIVEQTLVIRVIDGAGSAQVRVQREPAVLVASALSEQCAGRVSGERAAAAACLGGRGCLPGEAG